MKNGLQGMFLVILLFMANLIFSQQQVPILNYTTNSFGQVQLEINSSSANYYLVKVKPNLWSATRITTSITLGNNGKTILTEPLGAYPLDKYEVIAYPIATPFDTDLDGVNDIIELNGMPTKNPLNSAPSINSIDGVIQIESFTNFKALSIRKDNVPFAEHLNGLGFTKFMITKIGSANQRIYFSNSNTHELHESFAVAVGENHLANDTRKGELVYFPKSVAANGGIGTFAFNFTGGVGADFDELQLTHELLAANIPFLKNNLSYYVTSNALYEYNRDKDSFKHARIPVLLESDVFADLDYWGLSLEEGYGLFRKMTLNEIPGQKEIVLYESLPNELPRVGGIITSFIQTPLSHPNLRALQDKIPNAFIRDPLLIDSIAKLLDHYIYFKVEPTKFTIREATLSEVNEWYDKIRPKEEQLPPLNLCYKGILPLSQIGFRMFDGYGSKCTNVAVMRTFGFPDGTIPDGLGVPFYFYQEFMKYNNFFKEISNMIIDDSFKNSRIVREERLKIFRKKIKDAPMPPWMMQDLDQIPVAFAEGTSIRCRSSSNNEDLPGFSGAGLYTSKTHHTNEGHISKTIKQIYASLWNLRAFDERDFFRVNHLKASMGVLCHANYSDEKANGVAVSADPIYNTENTFYLNTQAGEALITNPDSNNIPEELLLDRISNGSNDYILLQHSNLIPKDSLLLSKTQMDLMRSYISRIHDEFKARYHAHDQPNFAMDLEYKLSKNNQLVIKQARPWVAFPLSTYAFSDPNDYLDIVIFPNPANQCITIQCDGCKIATVNIYNSFGEAVKTDLVGETNYYGTQICIDDLPTGTYILSSYLDNNKFYCAKKFVKY